MSEGMEVECALECAPLHTAACIQPAAPRVQPAACSLQPAACSPRVSQAVRGAYVVDAKIMTRAKRCVVSKY